MGSIADIQYMLLIPLFLVCLKGRYRKNGIYIYTCLSICLFMIYLLKKTLKGPWDSKEIKRVNPKGNQPWIFFGRSDTESETPIIWPPEVKSQLIEKDPDALKDWRQEEKRWQRMKWLDASLTQWTWVWVNSRRWWRIEKRVMLQSMGSQRVGHDLVMEKR